MTIPRGPSWNKLPEESLINYKIGTSLVPKYSSAKDN